MLLLLASAPLAFANVNADYLKVKVLGMYASEDENCTSPQRVFMSATADYKVMSSSTDFGSGEISDGTYPCVMIVMSDQIKFKPASDEGAVWPPKNIQWTCVTPMVEVSLTVTLMMRLHLRLISMLQVHALPVKMWSLCG